MQTEILPNNIPETIFDREDAGWGEAVFIQRYQNKVFKCLNFNDINIIKKYIAIHNSMKQKLLTIQTTNTLRVLSNDGNRHEIEQIKITFNGIEKDLLPVCDSQYGKDTVMERKYKEFSGESYIYTTPYIEGMNLREFEGKQNQESYNDFAINLKSLLWQIEDYITLSLKMKLQDGIFKDQMNAVNIKIEKIKGNTMHLIVTDIGASIGNLIHNIDKKYPHYFNLEDL